LDGKIVTDMAERSFGKQPMTRLIHALDLAWSAIREQHADLPDVVLSVASGGRYRKLGHFSPDRWHVLDRGDTPEVLIGAEGLFRGPVDVLGTLLHEAAHGLGHVRNRRTTSRRGHYHNGSFRELAEAVGLQVEYVEPSGWSQTTVPGTTELAYELVVADLRRALQLCRRPPPNPPTRRNYVPAECECGRRIRAPKTELRPDIPAIICGKCFEPFKPADDVLEEE
jgi:hypothetical protein